MSATEQPAADAPAPAEPRAPWHRRPFVPRKFPRSYAPRSEVSRGPLVNRALRWLLPWRLRDYPGVEKGAVEALSGRWALETLRFYQKGRRPLSVPLAGALERLIRVRVEAGLALIAELEAYQADNRDRVLRQRRAGLMAVDPTTGLSGREKAGKRRAVKPG